MTVGAIKGWQRLGNNDNTIQGKIESVLSEMVGEEIEIIGCSRTDAGVHALNQVANFQSDEKLAEHKVRKYLNQYLPNDISIKSVEEVPERFHARYNSKAKTYFIKFGMKSIRTHLCVNTACTWEKIKCEKHERSMRNI